MSRSTISLSLLALALIAAPLSAGPIEDRLAQAYGQLNPGGNGVLYDRVLPLSGIERFDGRHGAPTADAKVWRQIYDELRRASSDPAARRHWPSRSRCSSLRWSCLGAATHGG